jgi:hypothetical protein
MVKSPQGMSVIAVNPVAVVASPKM